MTKVGILTEKPSAARNFAAALGGKTGTYDGVQYEIVASRGHLLELADPSEMVPKSKQDEYASWDLGYLPWDHADFAWRREVRKRLSPKSKKMVKDKDAESLIKDIGRVLSACDEIVIASDVDPTGEGDLLAWEIVDNLGLNNAGKTFTRMEFLDETPKSLQTAFTNRRPVTSMEDEGNYRKAEFRSRWDMLSMQFTRVATKSSGSARVLRNGRLKSAITKLVGDQIDAYENYVRKPYFENRFEDEVGVVYIDPDADRFEKKEDVPQNLKSSTVTKDGVKRRKTAPPRLLDLAGLSALLSRRGIPAKTVLQVYQQLYDQGIVSYPRTEDKFVSPEQFTELLPLIDRIAGVVGIDPAVLTVRTARKTHVKTGGAHGANRPGTNVPASLDWLESNFGQVAVQIYQILAKNYLTMLAPDYEYDQHSGHVTDYPAFKGSVNIPQVLGWKGVFVVDADEDDDDVAEGATGLGSRAEPMVYEGAPKRPPRPTMTWLMKQLEKRNVGTGATRTSTYAEVTSGQVAQMRESKGVISLTELGMLNHRILADTKIGDLSLTEEVYARMSAIEAGTETADAGLAGVADLVRHDIDKMQYNAANLPEELRKKLTTSGVMYDKPESFTGTWRGMAVECKRSYREYRFSDEEVEALLADKPVRIKRKGEDGSEFTTYGKLEEQKFTNEKGKEIEFIGFQPSADPEVYAVGAWQGKEVKIKRAWGGQKFTEEELEKLFAGEEIKITRVSYKKKPEGSEYTVSGKLENKSYKGHAYIGFEPDFGRK